MATFVLTEQELPMGVDDFSALEERVLRMVDLLKTARDARAEAERKALELHQALEAQAAELVRAEEELETFRAERDQVRGRVERLLKQLDEIPV